MVWAECGLGNGSERDCVVARVSAMERGCGGGRKRDDARRGMIRHSITRLMALVPLLGLISLLAFGLVRLAPGGPFDQNRAPVSPEIERALRDRYHLDRHGGVAVFPVSEGMCGGGFGAVAEVSEPHGGGDSGGGDSGFGGAGGIVVSFRAGGGNSVGVCFGGIPGRVGDRVAGTVSLLAVCVPGFVAGPLLVMVFGVRLGWFPVALWGGPEHLVLPVITLGTYFAGRVSRLVREGMTEALRMEFIRTARAKGLGELVVLWRHAFPLASLPLLAYSGPLLADLLTGSFVVENLFQLPGSGR